MEYKWQCTECAVTVEGTDKNYLSFCRLHSKANGCNVVLIDEECKEVAKSLSAAQSKGIFSKPYSKKIKEAVERISPRAIDVPVPAPSPYRRQFNEIHIHIHL